MGSFNSAMIIIEDLNGFMLVHDITIVYNNLNNSAIQNIHSAI